ALARGAPAVRGRLRPAARRRPRAVHGPRPSQDVAAALAANVVTLGPGGGSGRESAAPMPVGCPVRQAGMSAPPQGDQVSQRNARACDRVAAVLNSSRVVVGALGRLISNPSTCRGSMILLVRFSMAVS